MPEKVALTTSAKRRLRRKKMTAGGKKPGLGDKTTQKGQAVKLDKTTKSGLTEQKGKKVKKPQEVPQKTAKSATNGQTKKKAATDQPMSVDSDSSPGVQQAKAKPAKAKPAKK